jgi:non-specific serine/threonine protein kinase
MSALKALPRNEWRQDQLDAEALEQLVVVCLERLADLARDQGQQRRATRLLDAVGFVRREQEAVNSGELTPREWEIARLVARGYSNRQIGIELVVSKRTVDTHVSHVLGKLELTSRAQIAAWVVQAQRRFRLVT